jgi:hypothetical protein
MSHFYGVSKDAIKDYMESLVESKTCHPQATPACSAYGPWSPDAPHRCSTIALAVWETCQEHLHCLQISLRPQEERSQSNQSNLPLLRGGPVGSDPACTVHEGLCPSSCSCPHTAGLAPFPRGWSTIPKHKCPLCAQPHFPPQRSLCVNLPSSHNHFPGPTLSR